MNRAILNTKKGCYTAIFKSSVMIGGIKDCLFAPPEHEQEFNKTFEKMQMLKKSLQMAQTKVKETEGEEKEAYQDVINDTEKEIGSLNSIRKFGGKPKQLKCRIISYIGKNEYEVEPIGMPKKWEEQLFSILANNNGEEE